MAEEPPSLAQVTARQMPEQENFPEAPEEGQRQTLGASDSKDRGGLAPAHRAEGRTALRSGGRCRIWIPGAAGQEEPQERTARFLAQQQQAHSALSISSEERKEALLSTHSASECHYTNLWGLWTVLVPSPQKGKGSEKGH